MHYNCYEIMCINKYRLWDRTGKITWFHILLAIGIQSFLFCAVTRSPAIFSQQTMALSCSTSPSLKSSPGDVLKKGCINDSRPGLMFHQHLQFLFPVFSRFSHLLCNCHLIFLTALFLTLERGVRHEIKQHTRF